MDINLNLICFFRDFLPTRDCSKSICDAGVARYLGSVESLPGTVWLANVIYGRGIIHEDVLSGFSQGYKWNRCK